MTSRFTPFALSFGFIVLFFYVLVSGRDLLIPLAIAIMVWYLLNALTRLFQNIPSGGWKMPRWLALLLSVCAFGITLFLVVDLISNNMSAAAEAGPMYQANLQALLEKMASFIGLNDTPSLSQLLEQLSVRDILGNIASALTRIASNTGLIIIYVTFLFFEQQNFDSKLAALIDNREKEKSVRNMLHRMAHEIETYVWIKTLMSILTGLISYAILSYVGVDYAAFWGFLVFLLNYIPNIGSLMGIILPSLLTLVQFDTAYTFIAVFGSLSIVQFLIGNVLEPRIMGTSLNLSPLVIILSLVLWGSIWGIAGMFLCVPIMVILVIICSNIPQARPIAIMLSSDGEIKHDT